MNSLDDSAFIRLFHDAFRKCFGFSIKNPVSESESKLFANHIQEKTGLVIGWKSIKNYSQYIINVSSGKIKNPSVATLDTLARYVMKAPVSNEILRKENESHYPYWFQYKDAFYKSSKKASWFYWLAGGAFFLILITLILVIFKPFQHIQFSATTRFTENFQSVDEHQLISHGWFIKSKDLTWWNRRGEKPGHLALFTLRGDNWPDSGEVTGIKNLLLRSIPSECFMAEIHLSNFIPENNWQQAGILILEDTSFRGRSIRLSVAYNDFFGGYSKPGEVIIQAITSLGNDFIKPEEIAHQPIFTLDTIANTIVKSNLENSALRIEKNKNKIRILYAGGSMENSAFKEVVSREFDFKPRYIGIFALKGFVNDSYIIPAYLRYFSLTANPCRK